MPHLWSHQDSLWRGTWLTTSGWRQLFLHIQMISPTSSLAARHGRFQTRAPYSTMPLITNFRGLDWLRIEGSKNMSPFLLGQEPELSMLHCFATVYWQGRLSVQLGILDHVMTCVAAYTMSCSIEWGLHGWGGSCLAGSGLESRAAAGRKARLTVFSSMVHAPLLSGLECFVLHKGDF